jgi:hypothetical protein
MKNYLSLSKFRPEIRLAESDLRGRNPLIAVIARLTAALKISVHPVSYE